MPAADFTIAHISDLHCGGPYFVPNLLERAIDEINDLEPDVVICTGDLTTFGYRPEYHADYFAAEQAKDAERLSLCFTANGLVHDEGHDYRGRDAIRQQTFLFQTLGPLLPYRYFAARRSRAPPAPTA